MAAPRVKTVTVGDRQFVVRPLFGEVAKALEAGKRVDGSDIPRGGTDELVAIVAIALKRTTPDVTEEWLLKNGDVGEYRDVMEALREVSNGKRAEPGEVPAP